LIGDHTDYNGGYVLPMAIEHRTAVVVGPSSDQQWHLVSEHADAALISVDAKKINDPLRRDWTSYIRGVIAGFVEAGFTVEPLCVAVASDVPVGAGLSSSAALEVAAATTIEAVVGARLEPWSKVLLCQRAEQRFAHVPCGFMDQAISVFAQSGKAMLLRCKDKSTSQVELQPDDAVVLVVNSMVRHNLASSAYADRRSSCERALALMQRTGLEDPACLADVGDPAQLDALCDEPGGQRLRARALHVVQESARAAAVKEMIESGSVDLVGLALNASHDSLRDLFEVSCAELDTLVSITQASRGVFGARMTGGGFGGCMVAFVDPEYADQCCREIADEYASRTGLIPAWFITSGARGAHAEPV